MVDETQISKPPKPTINHNSIKWLILLPLRAELHFTLQYEIPCICKSLGLKSKLLRNPENPKLPPLPIMCFPEKNLGGEMMHVWALLDLVLVVKGLSKVTGLFKLQICNLVCGKLGRQVFLHNNNSQKLFLYFTSSRT